MRSFFPFSSTTGRSESTNALFNAYVSHRDTIVNFFEAYENIQEKNLSTLDRCRLNSEIKCASKWSYNGLKQHASTIYTNAIFQKLQTEFKNATAYAVKEVAVGRTYELKRKMQYTDCEFESDEYKVQVSDDKEEFQRSCRKLECDGIHCCHVLKITERLDLVLIPASFVKYRWTKAADQDNSLVAGQEMIMKGTKSANAVQYTIMMAEVSDFCSSIAGDKRAVDLFNTEFGKLKDTIKCILMEVDKNNENVIGNMGVETGSTMPYRNPPIPEKRSKKKRRISVAKKVEKQAIAKAKKRKANNSQC